MVKNEKMSDKSDRYNCFNEFCRMNATATNKILV